MRTSGYGPEGGGGGMTNLWSSLLCNPYQAAQQKHFFFVSVKHFTLNSLQFLIFFVKLLNNCQKN